MIKAKKELPIIILLRKFHTQISYLSSIGNVMKNWGILEIFLTTHAEISVKNMLDATG